MAHAERCQANKYARPRLWDLMGCVSHTVVLFVEREFDPNSVNSLGVGQGDDLHSRSCCTHANDGELVCVGSNALIRTFDISQLHTGKIHLPRAWQAP